MQPQERDVFVTIPLTLTYCVMMPQEDEAQADSAFLMAMALLSVGVAKRCQSDNARSAQGTAGLQASTDHSCHKRMAVVSQYRGGCPLRRRRWC